MLVEVEDRLYNDMVAWCGVNNIDIVNYINNIIRKQLALDKYGDLNEKLSKKEEPKEEPTITVVEEPKVAVSVEEQPIQVECVQSEEPETMEVVKPKKVTRKRVIITK